jgi:hypothetical protein
VTVNNALYTGAVARLTEFTESELVLLEALDAGVTYDVEFVETKERHTFDGRDLTSKQMVVCE